MKKWKYGKVFYSLCFTTCILDDTIELNYLMHLRTAIYCQTKHNTYCCRPCVFLWHYCFVIFPLSIISACPDPQFNENFTSFNGEQSNVFGSQFSVSCKEGYYFAQEEFQDCGKKRYFSLFVFNYKPTRFHLWVVAVILMHIFWEFWILSDINSWSLRKDLVSCRISVGF